MDVRTLSCPRRFKFDCVVVRQVKRELDSLMGQGGRAFAVVTGSNHKAARWKNHYGGAAQEILVSLS